MAMSTEQSVVKSDECQTALACAISYTNELNHYHLSTPAINTMYPPPQSMVDLRHYELV